MAIKTGGEGPGVDNRDGGMSETGYSTDLEKKMGGGTELNGLIMEEMTKQTRNRIRTLVGGRLECRVSLRRRGQTCEFRNSCRQNKLDTGSVRQPVVLAEHLNREACRHWGKGSRLLLAWDLSSASDLYEWSPGSRRGGET